MSEETTQLLHALLEGQKEITAGVQSLDDRMTRMEGRFDKLEGRFDNLEGRFEKLEGRFDNLEGRFDKLEVNVDKLDKGQEEIKERLSKVESGVDLLAMKGWHHEQEMHHMKKKLEHSLSRD